MNSTTFTVHGRDLVTSCLQDDLDAARGILARHPELINDRNNCRETPLHYLAIEDCLAGVELLIKTGAAVEVIGTNDDTTPLFDAAGLGLVGMARLLIANGANVNRRQTFLEETPLHAAARSARNAETIFVLLDAGAEIEAPNSNKRTPLHEAVFMDNVITARALLQRGASRSLVDGFDNTPADDLKPDSPKELIVLLRGE
jgi:ankyrin repeat protein